MSEKLTQNEINYLSREIAKGFVARLAEWEKKSGDQDLSMRQMFDVADYYQHTGQVMVKFGSKSIEFKDHFKPKMHGDAGVDLYVTDDATVMPGQYVDLPSDIRIAMPNDWYAELRARSSTSKRRIYLAPGIIDCGYVGELFSCCVNLTDEPITVKRGERIAQIIFHRRINPVFVDVGEFDLPKTVRGQKGFGSTGT